MTAAEFAELLMSRGFPLSEIDNWNTGDLIDWCAEHDRRIRRQNGEDVPDEYDRYQKLKAMEPDIERLYANGKIREAKYTAYKKTLADCEAKLRG